MNISLLPKMIIDTIMICSGWVLAYYLRFNTGLSIPYGIPQPMLYFRLLPFIAIIWFATFYFSGFYRRSLKPRSVIMESFDIIQSSFLATLAFIAFTYFYEEYKYSRITTLIFAACHPLMLILGRSILRKIERHFLCHHPSPKSLLIGSCQEIKKTLSLQNSFSNSFHQIFGIICLDEVDEKLQKLLAEKHLPLIPPPCNWLEFLVENPIARAFITLRYDHPFLGKELNIVCEQIPDVKILPDLGHLSSLSLGIEIIDGLPVINVHDSPLTGWATVVKRLFDIAGSSILLILLSPFFLVIGCLVKLSSPGPVFYRQERMGMDGSRFLCFKFRSMPTSAEADTGAIWAHSKDNRATFIGRILRRTSLDEIPQLYNVLKGDMSLVGPRPERPVFVETFRYKIPGYMIRHKVKAGITGWAQVNGWRGSTSIEKRIECDLFYIKNWTIWLDLKILFLTIEEVISGKNAY